MPEKLHMEIGAGAYWLRLRDDSRGRLWARVCSVSDITPRKAYDCARLLWWYHKSAILESLKATVVLEPPTGDPQRIDPAIIDLEQRTAA